MIFLNWILFGLLAGLVAKILLPGDERMGWIRTVVVGIAGSFVGGGLGAYFGLGTGIDINHLSLDALMSFGVWSLPSFLTAVGGAFVLVLINRVVTRS